MCVCVRARDEDASIVCLPNMLQSPMDDKVDTPKNAKKGRAGRLTDQRTNGPTKRLTNKGSYCHGKKVVNVRLQGMGAGA